MLYPGLSLTDINLDSYKIDEVRNSFCKRLWDMVGSWADFVGLLPNCFLQTYLALGGRGHQSHVLLLAMNQYGFVLLGNLWIISSKCT